MIEKLPSKLVRIKEVGTVNSRRQSEIMKKALNKDIDFASHITLSKQKSQLQTKIPVLSSFIKRLDSQVSVSESPTSLQRGPSRRGTRPEIEIVSL